MCPCQRPVPQLQVTVLARSAVEVAVSIFTSIPFPSQFPNAKTDPNPPNNHNHYPKDQSKNSTINQDIPKNHPPDAQAD
jgi:hypothetical protein